MDELSTATQQEINTFVPIAQALEASQIQFNSALPSPLYVITDTETASVAAFPDILVVYFPIGGGHTSFSDYSRYGIMISRSSSDLLSYGAVIFTGSGNSVESHVITNGQVVNTLEADLSDINTLKDQFESILDDMQSPIFLDDLEIDPDAPVTSIINSQDDACGPRWTCCFYECLKEWAGNDPIRFFLVTTALGTCKTCDLAIPASLVTGLGAVAVCASCVISVGILSGTVLDCARPEDWSTPCEDRYPNTCGEGTDGWTCTNILGELVEAVKSIISSLQQALNPCSYPCVCPGSPCGPGVVPIPIPAPPITL